MNIDLFKDKAQGYEGISQRVENVEIEDTGVFHLGFDRDELVSIAGASGFNHVSVKTANRICKPYGDFPVFLLTAYR